MTAGWSKSSSSGVQPLPLAAMSRLHSFNLLPITIDPATKALSLSSSSSSHSHIPTELPESLTKITGTHRQLLSVEAPNQIPPPPQLVHPKRSAQVTKLRESANASYKKEAYPEAIRLYSLAIQMATDRPPWEPAGLVREELSVLYGNRSQAHMGMRSWVEGANDAQVSVKCKAVANEKGWWRRGKCLTEMGRWEDALLWVEKGLKFEEYKDEGELGKLAKEIRERVDRPPRKGKQ